MVDWKDSKDLLSNIRRFPEFCKRFLMIQPMGGSGLIPFDLNPVQRWYWNKFLIPSWEAGEPIRDCILKARQFGFSTLIEAFTLWSTLGHSAWNSVVVANEQDKSKTIFRMIRRFDRHLPDDGSYLPIFPKTRDSGGALEYMLPSHVHKPKMWLGREDEIVDLDSRIEVLHAGQRDKLGRTGTYHTVHASECAFWPELAGSLGALLSCCHDRPETAVFLETTANGMNEFHRFWTDLSLVGVDIPQYWRRIFVPWYWDEKYELELPDHLKRKLKYEFLNDYEERLFDRIMEDPELATFDHVTRKRAMGKLLWRRFAIHEKFFGDVAKFKQEFPATDAEAFLFSGLSVYSAAAVARMEGDVEEPIWRGDVLPEWRYKEAGVDEKGEHVNEKEMAIRRKTFSALWREKNNGCLNVYEWPEPLHEYVCFADVAEGKNLDASNKSHHGDFTCIQVILISKFPPLKQVAIWHGNCDPDVLGDLLVALGQKYNNALLGWEINGPGRSLSLQVVDKHRYGNIYMREDYDTISKAILKRPGWRTTRATKPLMVAVSQRFVRESDILVPDTGTVNEMKSFAVLGQNLYGAAVGNDDRVIALAGAMTIAEPLVATLTARTAKRKKALEEASEDYFEADPDEGGEGWDKTLGTEW